MSGISLPNDNVEAYTGHHTDRREDRTSQSLIQPRERVRGRKPQEQMAMVLTAQKPLQRERFGEHSEGLPGSTLERGMCGEKHQGLGRPQEFLGRYMDRVPYRRRGGRPKQQGGVESRKVIPVAR
jgi:hypothetical protein